MGCHTWFSRPITKDEFEMIKKDAPMEIYDLTGDSEENIKNGMYDKHLYDLLMKSYNENLPCVDGKYWWQLGYGSSYVEAINGSFVLDVRNEERLFTDVPEYYDTFRVRHYPIKVIHNKRELRRWMRKKYFDLEEWQLEKISKFFRENPGGVITFG